MLAENLENMVKRERSKGHRKGIKEGMAQGVAQGTKQTLRKLIQLKFGSLPGWAEKRIEKAGAQKLEAWTGNILQANSLEELLGEQ
ncbi:hypothetical protein [Desulfurivibrio alkaliphilus]|uniref:hypothetical protein n=1 Tax=Desulfurivibrio alkaliphilus TaxID=427923 RepID=UPI0001B3F107|nr:hypothetical protein [Desulfurivibrio alkaliphilus]